MSTQNPKPSPDALAFAIALDQLIAGHVARIERRAAPSPEYTSSSLPAGMRRRTFNNVCKRLADAGDDRVCKRGRQWVAKRDAIDEKPPRTRVMAKVFDGPWSPLAALEAAGVRPQR
jgi:hypothetical protein